ncbi:MAG TPA: GtrA family protein [Ferruginibacter sp.]|nr:GtrA family protein [Ferruginibacter sp.]
MARWKHRVIFYLSGSNNMKEKVTGFIDFFYPPFQRLMPLQTFRYAACGSTNTLLGMLLYVVSLNHIFNREIFHFGISAFKPHMAALFLSSTFTFLFGFVLNKFIVFTSSNLRGHIQLFRYFLSFATNLAINYFLLKLLVEYFLWDPVLSQGITISIIILISYLTQKHFSFR